MEELMQRTIGARVDASSFQQPWSNHSFSKLRVASDISGGTEFRKAFSVQLAEDGVNLLTLGTYVKLLVIFVVMTTLPLLPTSIPRAHANLAPTVPWTPAGPFENNLVFQAFSDQTAEFLALQAGTIDLTDWPLPPTLVSTFAGSPNYLVTSPVSEFGYFEIEFNQANCFWGVCFSNGNSAAGINIRQGIAHLIDKNDFITNQLGGQGAMIDNPVPPALGLPVPSTECSWDPLFNSCTNFIGAYHLSNYATSDGMAPTGSVDFCAAAQHFIAAGLASGMDSNCVLTGLSSGAATGQITMYARVDDPPRDALGTAIGAAINRLMGRSAVVVQHITIQAASTIIFKTSGSITGWWMYTGGYKDVTDFSNLYGLYNSEFAGSNCGGKSSSFGANYIFYCNPTFDHWSSLLEFNSTFPGAVAAGITSEDIFGQTVGTIPIWSNVDRFAYVNGWTGVNNGVGQGIPNYFTWLNAWNPSPALPNTIRQGMKQGTDTVNIYDATTLWDFFPLGEIYDTLLVQNPLDPSQLMGWTARSISVLSPGQLGYAPPAGTVESLRFSLRSDIYWQDGFKLTANDVKFTILSYRDVPAANFQSFVNTVVDVTVLNSNQLDVHLGKTSPFAETNIGLLPIIPQHIWAVGGTGFTADSSKTGISFDPVSNYALIGSGPYVCSDSTGRIGGGCTSTGTGSVGASGTFTLQRYGLTSTTHAPNSVYFRSSFNIKQWVWADANGNQNVDLADVSSAAYCFNKSVSLFPGCAHWDSTANGVGGNGDGIVELSEFSIVARWYAVMWTAPYIWSSLTNVNSYPPTVYEGSTIYP